MFGKLKSKDNSIEKSLPVGTYVHGIKVEKLPIGRYLKAINSIQNLPELLLKSCFPGMKPEEVLTMVKALDEDMLYQMMGQLVKVVPEQFLRLIAELIGADYDKIVNGLTPKELFEVLKAVWEVNEGSDFFRQIKAALGTVDLTKVATGFKS